MEQEAVLGIDPGKTGAACLLTVGREIEWFDWPKDNDLKAVYAQLADWVDNFIIFGAVLEKVASMHGQGVKSVFTFGTNNGHWEMALIAAGIPFFRPTPQQWQKGLVTKTDGPCPKTRSYTAASRMFPGAVLKGPQGGIKDGRSDALLMALFAKNHFGMDLVQSHQVGRRTK